MEKTVNPNKNMEEIFLGTQLRELQKLSGFEKELILNLVCGKRKDILKAIPRYEARIVAQRYGLEEAEDECVETQSKLKDHDEFLRKIEDEKRLAEEELVRARKQLEKVNNKLRAAKNVHQQFERQLEQQEKNKKKQQENLDQMLELVIVHSTASIKQIQKHLLAHMLVTSTEEHMFKSLMPDVVYDGNSEENFVEHLPIGFEKKYDEETKKAIIEYCNLVINTKLAADSLDAEYSNSKIIPLFGNQDIAEILRLNGYNFEE